MSESRRYRREMAKQLGLLSKKESFTQMTERYRRSIQMGEMFHTQNLQKAKNQEILQTESEENSNLDENSEGENNSENPYGFLGKR